MIIDTEFKKVKLITIENTIEHVLAQAAITKSYRLDDLNVRHSFLAVLEVGNSKITVLTDSVPVEAFLPGLQKAVFSLYPHPHMAKTGNSGIASSYKDTNPIMGALPAWSPLNLITFQRSCLLVQ